MATTCFMIEVVKPVTEYVYGCSNKHRVVYEQHIGLDYSEAPSDPENGWPSSCQECGVELKLEGEFEDGWKAKIGTHLYRRLDTGEEVVSMHGHGAGAIADVTDFAAEKGPDGRAYAVFCPPGGISDIWFVDSTAASGGKWTRSGEPPKLTVTPSIRAPRYHGFLTDGVLTDDIGDR